MAAVDAVQRLADEAAASAGLVLEDVTVQPAGRRRVVRVVDDLPDDAVGGVPMEAVAAVSQRLSQRLDETDAIGGGAYTLEVTSPGVDRPLTQRRHWARARGRLVTVSLHGGAARTGRLEQVGDEGIVLAGTALSWDDVTRGKVEVEFSRPATEDEPDDGLDEPDELDDDADVEAEGGPGGGARDDDEEGGRS
jgi:ribosome maturation factor RimP